MKRYLGLALLWLFLLLLSAPVVAAQTGIRPPTDNEIKQQRQDEARHLDERASFETIKRKDKEREATPLRPDDSFYNRKLTEAQKKLIEPAAEDQAANREFLRQDRTGLIRLLPRGKYEFTATVAAGNSADLALPIRGGGAFYSFAEKKHSYGPWSEITFQEGRLVVGFIGQSLGVMTVLGDVPLESVTMATPAVAYLARLMPPTQLAVAREQHTRNFLGFQVGNAIYNANLPALVNQTYVLRSTVYKKEGRMQAVPGGGAVYVPHPYEYGGVDQLIAFRILRAGADGGITLLWKRLQKFTPPKLKQQ
jgi:hypothetical protein